MRNQLEEMAKFTEKLEGLSVRVGESQTAFDSRFEGVESRLSSIESKLEAILKLLSTNTSNPTLNLSVNDGQNRTQDDKPLCKALENMVKNLKMPVFDGVNNGIYWLLKVERRKYSEDEKLRLNGEVLVWFNRQENLVDWNDFRTRFLDLLRLYALRQERSFSPSDYVSEFEVLLSEVRGLDDDTLQRIFMGGLKREVQEMLMLGGKRQELTQLVKPQPRSL